MANVHVGRKFIDYDGNPDDLIQCPVMACHTIKRKKLPYHVPACRERYGKHLLPCPYTQYHLCETKQELSDHVLVCSQRNQMINVVRPAPAYNKINNEVGISNLARATVERQKESATVPNHRQTARVDHNLAQESSSGSYALSDATRRLLPFLDSLTETVLFSYERLDRLLGPDESMGAYDSRYTHDLPALAEEDEDGVDENPVELMSSTNQLRQQNAGFPSNQTQSYPELPEDYTEAEFIPRSIAEKDLEQSKHGIPRDVARRYHSYEDDRDAQELQEERAAYVVDWHKFPKLYQPVLQKKFARDKLIYKTGLNPRYVKEHDRPGNKTSVPDPRQFQDLAAWYEDLIFKPRKPASPNRNPVEFSSGA